jgi:hypothetical protein
MGVLVVPGISETTPLAVSAIAAFIPAVSILLFMGVSLDLLPWIIRQISFPYKHGLPYSLLSPFSPRRSKGLVIPPVLF